MIGSINIKKLKCYNSTNKYLLSVDGEAICLFDSVRRLQVAVRYLGGAEVDIKDGKIKRLLDRLKEV